MEPFRAAGYELRRNVVLPGALLAAAIGGWALAHYATWSSIFVPFAMLAIVFGLPFAFVTLVRDAFPLARRVSLAIDASGLVLDGNRRILAEDIAEAKLVPRPGRDAAMVLELGVGRKRTKRVRLWLSDADARRAMELLGAMPGERKTRFAVMVPFWKRFAGWYAAWALLVPILASAEAHPRDALVLSLIHFVTTVPLNAALVAWLTGFLRARLFVGSEGFATRWLVRERFTSFREVVDIEKSARLGAAPAFDTIVVLRSGKRIRLAPIELPDTMSDFGTASRALHDHVREAWQRFRRVAGAGGDPRAALAREGRSGRDWLAGIDAVVGGGAGRYRDAAMDPEQLAGIARDPNASAEARAGAAAALLRTRDPSHRHTVRVAADACVEPQLRDVLVALAEAEEDEAIAQALDRARR